MIAKKTQADVFVVKAKKTYHTQGFKKFFWGGKSVFFNEIPELESLTFDANQYERIFIGTPIWVGTMAPPIKSFC
ncbi:MAG: flavodoxin family protein, partial [Culicoidibacterales bacterium]